MTWTALVLRDNLSAENRTRLADYATELNTRLYQPVEREQKLRGRGAKRALTLVERPLLGNYALLECLCATVPYRTFLGLQARSRGVMDFVRSGSGYPATVPDRVAMHLLYRDEQGEFDRFKKTRGRVVPDLPDWLLPGASVIVKESHCWLGGTVFVVESTDSRTGRVSLRMPGLECGNLPIQVHLDDLRGY